MHHRHSAVMLNVSGRFCIMLCFALPRLRVLCCAVSAKLYHRGLKNSGIPQALAMPRLPQDPILIIEAP